MARRALPLPKSLQPPPKRPGEDEDATRLTPAEAGITVVDWIDERMALSPAPTASSASSIWRD